MRSFVFILSLLFSALGCKEEVSFSKGASDFPLGFDLNLNCIMEPNLGPVLHFQMQLDPGNYVISPLSTDTVMGKLQLEFMGDNMGIRGTWSENPISKSSWDPHAQTMVRIVTQDTEFRIPLAPPNDSLWQCSGELFFVVEPVCVPYTVKFKLEERGEGPKIDNIRIHRLN